VADALRYVRATRAHADLLAAVHAAAVRPGEPAWQAMAFDALIGGARVDGVVACAGETPAGFVLWRTAADEAEVLLIAVVPELRRRGFGRVLLRHAIAAARTAGAATMWLEVAADNPGPIALYRAEGFAEAGRRPGYYHRTDGIRADALVFRLAIAPGHEVIMN
jgi:[ribosomal protein S18]-alanine N-acetyltransferase